MKKLLIVLFVVALVFTGCGQSAKTSDSKVDKIKAAGKLVVYTNAEFPPFESMEGNEIVGVDIEIGKAIAEKMGVTLDVVNADFGGIVASIASGKGDLAISAFPIDEERKAQVDFSIPYVDSVQYIVLPEDSEVAVMENLADMKLGVQLGTTGEMLVRAEIDKGVLAGTNTVTRHYNSSLLAMADLVIGRISAVVTDELVAINIANENPGYKAIPLVYESGSPLTEQFGVAIQKGNEDLVAIVNEVLTDMLDKNLIEQYIEQYRS